jgi:hypothetical protein
MRTRRFGLGLVPLIGLCAGSAWAQEGPITTTVSPNVVVTAWPIAPPVSRGNWNPVIPPDPHKYLCKGPVATWARERWGCFAHHTMDGCGSPHSECTFIFGSCRAFFGQPCLKTPPPLPAPAGYEGSVFATSSTCKSCASP